MEITIKFNRDFKTERDVEAFMKALLGTQDFTETNIKLDASDVKVANMDAHDVKAGRLDVRKVDKKAEELSEVEMVEPAKAEPKPKPASKPKAEPAEEVKLTDLQKLFISIIKTTPEKKDDAVAILKENGASKISNLDPSAYSAVKNALDALIGE